MRRPVPDRRRLGPPLNVLEEAAPRVRLAAEAVAQDAECAGRVSEVPRDIAGREPFDEEGPESLVLPVEGVLGGEKKPALRSLCRYLFSMTDSHIMSILHSLEKSSPPSDILPQSLLQ